MLYTVRVCMPVQLSQRQRLSTESCSCLHHKKLYHQTGPARQDAFVVEIYSVDYFYLKIFYTMITCSKKKYALNRDIEITIHVNVRPFPKIIWLDKTWIESYWVLFLIVMPRVQTYEIMLMGFNDIMYHKYALLNNEIKKHLGLTFMHYTDDGKF